MKLFKVCWDDGDYDTYDSFVVVAESGERAREIVNQKYCEDCDYGCWARRGDEGDVYFKEIRLDEEAIVLGSFNAG